MASGTVGEHYTSTYILQRLWFNNWEDGAGHQVYVELQMRRTNSYGGTTYQYPSNSWISINGNRYDWGWWSGDYPIIPAYNNDWLIFASRQVWVGHNDGCWINISGGNYNMGGYLNGDCSGDIWLDSTITAPTGVWGNNLDIGSDTNDGRAYSYVNVDSWGKTQGSGTSWWVVARWYGAGSDGEWASSPSTGYIWWNGLNSSTNKSACAITSWWPEGCNLNGYRTWGGAKYIASPSGPSTTAIGSVTDPSLTIKGTVSFKGGDQNSSTCNNGTIKYWRFHYKEESASSYVNMTPNYTSNTTFTYPKLSKSTFTLGTNYNIVTRARNSYGAYGDTWQTVYCPTGVTGSVSENTPKSFIVTPSATYAGTLASSTGGTMAQYVMKYSTDKSTVDAGGGTELSMVYAGSKFSLSDLQPGTTYYYRIYGWNILGLSQVSNTLSNTTIPRYYPEAKNLELTAKGMGANVKLTVIQTGGLSENELPIESLKLYRKPASSSAWEQVGDEVTGLSLKAGDTYTFTDAWTEAMPSSGNYNVRVLMSNGTDEGYSPTYTITAPTSVTVKRYREENDCPVQINATATGVATNGIHHWRLSWKNGSDIDYRELASTDTEVQLHSCNYLLYRTIYTVWSTIFDNFGCWTKSADSNVTTDDRFNWYAVVSGVQKSATPIFAYGTETYPVNYSITEVYYIVANSLGSKGVGDDLRNTRLTFIPQTLNYRPESVAKIVFSNGRYISYEYVADTDTYQFCLWGKTGNIVEVFHDGNEWKNTTFDLPDTTGYTISELVLPKNSSGKEIGMNASAPFSTTKCSIKPIWENN